MAEQEARIYIGNGKRIPSKNTQYPERLKLSFSKADLSRMADFLNERGYVNLVLTQRKAQGKHGETHCMYVDTWKPTHGQDGKPLPANPNSNVQTTRNEGTPEPTPPPMDHGDPADIPF